jgi:hypothetical protein
MARLRVTYSMPSQPEEPGALRRMAHEMRDQAARATLPGYAEKMLRAALELERQADELEAARVKQAEPKR